MHSNVNQDLGDFANVYLLQTVNEKVVYNLPNIDLLKINAYRKH